MHLFKFYETWKNYPEEFKNNLIYNTLLSLHRTYMLEHAYMDRETLSQFGDYCLFCDTLFYFPQELPITELKCYKDFFLPEPAYFRNIKCINDDDSERLKEHIKDLTKGLKENISVKEFYEVSELEKLYYVWKSDLYFSFHEIFYKNCNLDIMENLQWIIIDSPTYYWIGNDEYIGHRLCNEILQNIELNKKIKGLSLISCSITKIDFLNEHKELEYLNLTNNNINNIAVLKELKNLKKININHTSVNDLSPLICLDLLSELICLNINVSLDYINEFQKKIPNCKIIHNAKPSKAQEEI